MGWIKRNLFFFIGVVVGLLLLGLAGWYDWQSWAHNTAKITELNEVYGNLKNNTIMDRTGHPISPGNEKIDNVKIATEQEKQLREWLRGTQEWFKPVAPIPNPVNGAVTSEAFAAALHRTVAQLQREAAEATVQLPPQYNFSFTAQNDKVRFPPASLEPLSIQLGEVKVISEILFGAHINGLDGIQRRRVSDDDAGGPAADYLEDVPVTGKLALLTPYQVSFRAFGQETAQVLGAFAASPHGFIVKSISIQPAGAAAASTSDAAAALAAPAAPTIVGGAPAPVAGRGGLVTLLNEQLLHVTLQLYVVNLTSKN
jgi:hypothetical protein